MAKFIFPLQALLEQRKHIERTRQMAVASIERERLELESRITSMQSQIRSHKLDLRDLLTGGETSARLGGGSGGVAGVGGGGVDTRTVRLQANASLFAQGEAQRLAMQLAGIYRRLDGARRELLDATTRRRAVELLKEKRLEQWRKEQARKETAALDELSTMRAARIRAEGVLGFGAA